MCAIVVFEFSSIKDAQQVNAVVRTGTNEIEKSNYFDSITKSNDAVQYKTIAKKEISYDALSDYQTASCKDDEYLISFEVTTNLETATINLDIYFDDTKEIIIENLVGVPMTNYNDEHDVLFTIDDEHLFLSELTELSRQEQCSWFSKIGDFIAKNKGNIFHKSLNLTLQALAYVEPAIKILNYVAGNELYKLYEAVKYTKYGINYAANSKKTQPKGFVYGQNAYSDWKFGFSNIDHSGCAVVAGYNLAHAKGVNISLAKTIFLYESLGIEVGVAQGFAGANPYQISYFLKSVDISYNKVTNYKTFEKYMENSSNYYVILASWNGEELNHGAHVFMIDKDNSKYLEYRAYNYDGWRNSNTNDQLDYSVFFHRCSIKNTFMCAYFVSK